MDIADNVEKFRSKNVTQEKKRSVQKFHMSIVKKFSWTNARNCQRKLEKRLSRKDVFGQPKGFKPMILVDIVKFDVYYHYMY